MHRFAAIFVFVCVIAAVLGDPAPQLSCTDSTQCTVRNVDITPCAERTRCVFKRGNNATINFEIVPEFSAEELEAEVSYRGLPFSGLDRDACKYTACPATKGVAQTVRYSLYLAKKISLGSFQIKWKVWNKADPSQLCCFLTEIKIKK